jgi:Fis family transcriptional regulator, factor for inversion stimulation protein
LPIGIRHAAIRHKTTGRGPSSRRFVREEMPVNAVRLPVAEAAKQTSSQSAGTQSALSECVSRTVRRYLADIGDTECAEGLHALVLREVEVPLLREVLAFHDGNQSRAASALGINRATLRKKLAAHGLL